MNVDGLHHVTAITADVDANVDFYGRLLGLRLVWQGVNADDPEMRHVAYGDERGTPGSVVTFFDMPGIGPGRPGTGMVHRLLLRVADAGALDFWERRLQRGNVAFDAPAAHYKVKFTDEAMNSEIMADLPLSYAHENLDDALVPTSSTDLGDAAGGTGAKVLKTK